MAGWGKIAKDVTKKRKTLDGLALSQGDASAEGVHKPSVKTRENASTGDSVGSASIASVNETKLDNVDADVLTPRDGNSVSVA